jgi:hypothetical protein
MTMMFFVHTEFASRSRSPDVPQAVGARQRPASRGSTCSTAGAHEPPDVLKLDSEEFLFPHRDDAPVVGNALEVEELLHPYGQGWMPLVTVMLPPIPESRALIPVYGLHLPGGDDRTASFASCCLLEHRGRSVLRNCRSRVQPCPDAGVDPPRLSRVRQAAA